MIPLLSRRRECVSLFQIDYVSIAARNSTLVAFKFDVSTKRLDLTNVSLRGRKYFSSKPGTDEPIINNYSWSASKLRSLGETIPEVEERPLLIVTEEVIHAPPEKIKKLINLVLSLDLVEINQLIRGIQAIFAR